MAPDYLDDELGLVYQKLVEKTCLVNLSLRCCDIGRLELPCMAAGLKGNRFLRTLYLYGNYIDDRCCLTLMEALKGSNNNTLEVLGL